MEQMMNYQNQYIMDSGIFYFRVQNQAGYLSVFQADYLVDGRVVSDRSSIFASGGEAKLSIPANATNVTLTMRAFMGLNWSDIAIKFYSTMVNACFIMYGTIFNPSVLEVNCGSLGASNGSNVNPCCRCSCTCCCCCCNPCQEGIDMLGYDDSYEGYVNTTSIYCLNSMY